MSYSIVLAEDQGLIRDSLKSLLSAKEKLSIAAAASNGKEALELCRIHKPDLVLLDIKMPELSGLDAARILKKEKAACKIVLLTTFEEEQLFAEALLLGVEGIFLKDIDPDIFYTALCAIAQGLLVYDPVIKKHTMNKDSINKQQYPFGLTEKDVQLIRLIAEGHANKGIASILSCSEGTIKNRVSSILNKMGLEDRTQIAVYAIRNGLLEELD